MAILNEAQLVQKLKEGIFDNAYYFYGKDVATTQLYSKRLIAKLVPKDAETLNFHRFSGDNLSTSLLSDATEQLPIFSERVCIHINDLNAESFNADQLKALNKIISDLPTTTTIVVTITGFDPCSGKRALSPKNKKVADTIAKNGVTCEFPLKTPSDLSKTIISKAGKLGCTISKADAQYLATRCLSDQFLINNELEKITAYLSNQGVISRKEIDLLVAPQLDSSSFDLAKAAANFQASRALSILDQLFYQRIEPIVILYSMTSAFIDLYRARLAINAGKTAKDIITHFQYAPSRAFVVNNALRDCSRIPIEHLRFCLHVLSSTDNAIKSTRTDSRVLLEQAIISMCQKR